MIAQIKQAIKEKPFYEEENGLIYNNSCFDILAEIPDNTIDICITDPPYGINYRSNRASKTGKMKDFIINDKNEDDLLNVVKIVIPHLIRILKKNSEIYWFCAGGGNKPILVYTWLEFIKYESELKVKNLLVWNKQYAGMGWDWRFQYETIFQLVKGSGIKNSDISASNVISAKKVIPQKNEHPTSKSIEIISHILKRKTKKNDIILDPFIGGGTTAVASKELGRRFIGIEIDVKYCKMCVERLRQGFLLL